MKFKKCVTAFVIIAAFSSACTQKTEQTNASPTPAPNTLLTQKNLFKTADPNDTPYRLYQLFAPDAKNINLSPLSLNMAFAELYLGADGNTKELMEQVFGFKEGSFSFEPEFKLMSDAEKARAASADKKTGAQIIFANSVWVKNSHLKNVLFSYKQDLSKHLDGMLFALDAKKVNSWVAEATQQKITKLIEKLDPKTLSLFVNALYLKADWETPFAPNLTYPENFRSSPHAMVKTLIMHRSGKMKYFENDLSKWVALPYQGLPLEMLVGLPVKDDAALKTVEDKLSHEMMASVVKGLKEETVDLSLPKFKFDTQTSLKEIFVSAGYDELFETANFSKFSSDKELKISEVIQATAIQVDEKGTEAAAATAVAVVEGAHLALGRKEFKADRAFLFMIRNTQSGQIYFLGRVYDPRN